MFIMKSLIIKKFTDLKEIISNFDYNPKVKDFDLPLDYYDTEIPDIKDDEVLIKIGACAVCHTELDEIEGRITPMKLPVIPGHQIVGKIIKTGKNVKKLKESDRVGVGWINSACGKCWYCQNGLENLCADFVATGKDVNGGYAEYTKVRENYAALIPDSFSDEEASPLLCAGAVGYRSLKLTGITNGLNLGFLGFGASNHLVLQIAAVLYPDSKLFVFARSSNERAIAKKLGAFWTGDTADTPPEKINAIIDTTPVWKPITDILQHLAPAGRLVINNIRKENYDIEYLKNIDYARDLWMEKEIKSVANVTFNDIKEVIEIAYKFNIKPQIEIYSLSDANNAILDIKNRKINGSKVLKIS